MTGLLADYLPLIVFIGVSLFIAVALLVAPFIVAYSSPIPKSSRPTSAASTPSTTRA